MQKCIAAGIIVLLVAGSAIAAEPGPQVMSPTNGARIGPNVDVVGRTVGKQFVVIQTDVYVEGADRAPWATVPGHRHWTDDAGNFNLRVSTPRIWYRGGQNAKLTYKIRTFTVRPGGGQSETTTVTCYPE